MNFEEICKELQKYHEGSSSQKDTIITLPAIFGKQYHENFISSWLAYLFDPNLNGFGVEPLKALLSLFCDNPLLEDDDLVVVETEHTFDDERRIDILISTPHYLIGIENKIFAAEQENQTNDYWGSIEGKAHGEKKNPIGIYLTPSKNNKNTPQSKNFHHLDYGQICEVFKAIPYDYRRDSRKNYFFYEFILYVEEVLMNQSLFPEINGDVRIYLDNKKIVDNAISEYSKYVNSFKAWLVEQTTQIYGHEILADNPQKNYWQLRKSDSWRGNNFDIHFELCWDKTASKEKQIVELIECDVELAIHVETRAKEVKDFFELKYSDKNLHNEKIKVNFSSEEKAKESLVSIIALLKSDSFQAHIKKVEDFLNNDGG